MCGHQTIFSFIAGIFCPCLLFIACHHEPLGLIFVPVRDRRAPGFFLIAHTIVLFPLAAPVA